MATLEELERREKVAHERVVARKKQMAKKERRYRNHACMTIGGMVLQYLPDKDWKQLDFDKLAKWLKKYSYKIEECVAPELEPDEAYKRLRQWETGGKQAAAKNAAPETSKKPARLGGAEFSEVAEFPEFPDFPKEY